MLKRPATLATCYTPGEIARAAGTDIDTVRARLGDGATRWDALVPRARAIELVRALRAQRGLPPGAAGGAAALFEEPAEAARPRGFPLAASSTAHALVLAGAVLISTVGADSARQPTASEAPKPIRMVYLALPGPGGGGGGGGMRQVAPPPRAKRQGPAAISSPVPVRKPPPVEPPPTQAEPPEPAPEIQPPVAAPVAEVAGDEETRGGVLEENRAVEESRGPGTGGGTGNGSGTGVGEGDGSGLGPGSGGGTGGGPYRPGSGVEPPIVLREVRPTYTEQARQRGITGEVVLEIVVLHDGSVGRVRVLTGLGSGLDERAIEAVRQWKFEPARLRGAPVDVMVEVAVEFRLR